MIKTAAEARSISTTGIIPETTIDEILEEELRYCMSEIEFYAGGSQRSCCYSYDWDIQSVTESRIASQVFDYIETVLKLRGFTVSNNLSKACLEIRW